MPSSAGIDGFADPNPALMFGTDHEYPNQPRLLPLTTTAGVSTPLIDGYTVPHYPGTRSVSDTSAVPEFGSDPLVLIPGWPQK